MNQKLINMLKGFFWACVVCAIITMCTSCRTTRYISVPEIHEKYITKTDSILTHDSIYLHDSIFSFVHGDTIFMNKYQTKYIEKLKYINHTDTIIRTDSITKPVEVVKYKTRHDGYLVAFGLLVAIGLYAYIRRRF